MIQQSLSSELLGVRNSVWVLSFRTDINEEPEVIGVYREVEHASDYVERNLVQEAFHKPHFSQWKMANGNLYEAEMFPVQ